MARPNSNGPPKKTMSSLQMWVEEAWDDWLKIALVGAACVVAFLAYKFDLVQERFAGAVLALAVVGVSVASTAPDAWPRLDKPLTKGLFCALVAIWVVATGYPTVRTAMPPAPLGEVRLMPAKPTATLKVPSNGPYIITVSGRFKHEGGGEAVADYSLGMTGQQGTSDEVNGSIKRELVRNRATRRGGSTVTVQERTEHNHRLRNVRGSELTISSSNPIDDQLEDGLHIEVRPAPVNPILFIVLGAIALLGAVAFDARLVDLKRKLKTHLSAGVGTSYVFALYYPEEATPHSLVRPALAALILALVVGGLGGWVLGALGRFAFGPKPPKVRKGRR